MVMLVPTYWGSWVPLRHYTPKGMVWPTDAGLQSPPPPRSGHVGYPVLTDPYPEMLVLSLGERQSQGWIPRSFLRRLEGKEFALGKPRFPAEIRIPLFS